jgi:hypothetical protein
MHCGNFRIFPEDAYIVVAICSKNCIGYLYGLRKALICNCIEEFCETSVLIFPYCSWLLHISSYWISFIYLYNQNCIFIFHFYSQLWKEHLHWHYKRIFYWRNVSIYFFLIFWTIGESNHLIIILTSQLHFFTLHVLNVSYRSFVCSSSDTTDPLVPASLVLDKYFQLSSQSRQKDEETPRRVKSANGASQVVRQGFKI